MSTHVVVLKEKSERIPRSEGKMSKRLGEFIGCKDKTSSWRLNGFPDGSNNGSAV